ncbi:hypothetical protein SEVIR_6G187550v4 [Setaria viridis]
MTPSAQNERTGSSQFDGVSHRLLPHALHRSSSSSSSSCVRPELHRATLLRGGDPSPAQAQRPLLGTGGGELPWAEMLEAGMAELCGRGSGSAGWISSGRRGRTRGRRGGSPLGGAAGLEVDGGPQPAGVSSPGGAAGA